MQLFVLRAQGLTVDFILATKPESLTLLLLLGADLKKIDGRIKSEMIRFIVKGNKSLPISVHSVLTRQ